MANPTPRRPGDRVEAPAVESEIASDTSSTTDTPADIDANRPADADQPGAGNDTAEEPTVPVYDSFLGVKYEGAADRRTLTEDDQRRIGVLAPTGELVWSADNHFVIDKASFTEETLEAVLKLPGFSLV